MKWYQDPEVDQKTEDGVDVWRPVGDWTRDLPLDTKRRVDRVLDQPVEKPLIVDLTNLGVVDSWGEETICNAMQRVLDEGHSVVWVWDAARNAEYTGFRRSLERRKLSLESFVDVEAARKAAGAGS